MPIGARELRGKETLHAIPGNCNPGGQAAQAQNVDIDVLHSPAGREIVMAYCCPHSINLIGRDGRPDTAAAQQDTAIHDSLCDGASQRHGKIWVVVVPVVLQVAEVHNLVASCAKQDLDLFLHLISAVISRYADFHALEPRFFDCTSLLQAALSGPNPDCIFSWICEFTLSGFR